MSIFGFGRGKDKETGKAADKDRATQAPLETPPELEIDAAMPEREPSEAATSQTEPDEVAQTPIPEPIPDAPPASAPEAAPKAQKAKGSISPYTDSAEHLAHVLAWADALVRAQTVRWRHMIAAHKSESYWGMVHITQAEVDHYLDLAFTPPGEMPEAVVRAMQPYLDAAQHLVEAVARRRQRTPDNVELRLIELERRFALTPLDMAIIALCLLPELDGRYRRLYGYLQDDASRTRPSVELLLQMLQPVIAEGEPARTLFNESGPLRRYHLMTVTDERGVDDPLPARSVNLDARIIDYLLGSDRLDNHLKGWVEESSEAPVLDALILPSKTGEHLATLGDWLSALDAEHANLPTLFLYGAYGSGRREAAQALCAVQDMPLLMVDTQALRQAGESWARSVDLILREAILRSAALYWRDTEKLREAEAQGWAYLLGAIEAHPGLVFLAGTGPWDPAGHFHTKPFMRIDFSQPDFDLRRQLWERYLPTNEHFSQPAPEREDLIRVLANGFQLSGGQISDAVVTARGEAMQRNAVQPRLEIEDIYEGCRRQSNRGLIKFAQLIEPRTELDFEDLILPPSNKLQLNELRTRIRYRSQVYTGLGIEQRLSLGRGLIALFTGSSGTGKTMAAELLGREYGMQVYKLDLASVVSKYVGETEKNLARVFDEAEDANAILLFDEGDAIFGKRGEVKDARDRWANTEVNFLLQRIEEYSGVVIITTNFRQNMDAAFLRRIHVIVDFPRPDAKARLRIWRGMFPPNVQRPDDAELLALSQRFALSGGNIKNVVVDAAFRAVAEGSDAITLEHLVLGIGREWQKMGKALTRGDFGADYYAWVEAALL